MEHHPPQRRTLCTVALTTGLLLACLPSLASGRTKDLGVTIGVLPAGPLDAITDVAGVRVGQVTLEKGTAIHTGVTAILPHGGNLYQDRVPAGIHVANGFGKFAGSTQIVELGEIETPILLTNTLNVPEASAAAMEWTLDRPGNEEVRTVNPVVGETNDGLLNDIRTRPVRIADARRAIETAAAGPVAEGTVGAGTGTVAFGWKGGIGTASRRLPASLGGWTVGVLVHANYGGVLTIAGVPVGLKLGRYPFERDIAEKRADGSVVIVIATDAPLSDRNLRRLAERAFVGIARTGSAFSNGSGDYAIAFSTHMDVRRTAIRRAAAGAIPDLPNDAMSPLFQAVAEASEESVLNALLAARTVPGHRATVEALPIARVRAMLKQAAEPAAMRNATQMYRTARRIRRTVFSGALLLATPTSAQTALATVVPNADRLSPFAPRIAALFEDFAREQHVPGLVYGIVAHGRLVLVRGIGVQDVEHKAPVTSDSLFRIASMSKAFTALAILDLRDRGLLSLDAPAETYVPGMRGWKYPTSDSPRIRIRDLLNHVAGFVGDNPWGDRQQPLPEADFTARLAAGVPFSRVPQTSMEYSNVGYALLGRIVSNVSGQPYDRYIVTRFFRPLGMTHTGYEIAASPQEQRALGYRWENDSWLREPDMAHGAFGAMGGIQTSAEDYSRYVAWLLSAWPPRDGPEKGPLRRATMRELVQGSNFVVAGQRRPALGGSCMEATAYAMGFRMIADCDLGQYMQHTGGYPGYGSVVMLAPDAGICVFAFANRTYAAPVAPAYRAMKLIKEAGLLEPHAVTPTSYLRPGYEAVGAIWRAGDVLAVRERLAMNFLMDRSAANWKSELARLRRSVGECRTDTPVVATSMLAGNFRWTCGKGTLSGSVLLAPTLMPTIQEIRLSADPAP